MSPSDPGMLGACHSPLESLVPGIFYLPFKHEVWLVENHRPTPSASLFVFTDPGSFPGSLLISKPIFLSKA